MKKLSLALMVGLIVLIIGGCTVNHQAERTIKARLLTISKPYSYEYQIEVVSLFWEKPVSPMQGAGFEDGELRDGSVVWKAFPIEKIPLSLIGQYINKKVKLTYKLVDDDTPLVYIVKFEVLD